MKSGFAIGVLVGLLLAGPLVSTLYLLHTTLGTPFTPFDLFDALARILPGRLITFGIDSMVRVLMFLGLKLSSSSKTAEQIQAIGIFLCACAAAAGIFFVALREKRPRAVPPGVFLGIATALPMTALSGHPVWTIIALTVWGIAVSGARQGLMQPSGESAERRRFLIHLGGATASITVVGAAVAMALRTSLSKGVVHATSEVELPN